MALVTVAHLYNAQRKQLLFRLVQPLFILERECLVHRPVRDVQVIDESGRSVAVFLDGKHVDVVQHVAHYFRLGAITLNQQVFLLDLLRFFKLQLGGQILHLLVQHLLHFACVPFQDFFDLGDVLHVILVRLLPDTRAGAVLDVIFQANLELPRPYVLGRQLVMARAQRKQMLDEVQ